MYRFCLLLVFLVLHQASVSNAKPADASTSTCQCGVPNRSSRIQGGIPTEKNEYPWQAAIVSSSDSTPYAVFCGGTVISNQHVLTSAGCCSWLTAPQISVLLQEHRTDEDDDGQWKLPVSKMSRHPRYNVTTSEYDLCVVTLAYHLNFGSSRNLLAPACMPEDPRELYVGQQGVISGWGKTGQSWVDPPSPVLLETTVDIVDNAACPITGKPSLLCTARSMKGPCFGDKGGPLMVPNARLYRYELAGVVSAEGGWARSAGPPRAGLCNMFSRVYARVTTALDWIKKVTEGSTTCP